MFRRTFSQKNLTFSTNVLFSSGLSFGGEVFEDGKIYRIYFSFRNQAGVDSDWYGTEEIIADFSSPESTFELTSGQVGQDTGENRPVVNGDASRSDYRIRYLQ